MRTASTASSNRFVQRPLSRWARWAVVVCVAIHLSSAAAADGWETPNVDQSAGLNFGRGVLPTNDDCAPVESFPLDLFTLTVRPDIISEGAGVTTVTATITLTEQFDRTGCPVTAPMVFSLVSRGESELFGQVSRGASDAVEFESDLTPKVFFLTVEDLREQTYTFQLTPANDNVVRRDARLLFRVRMLIPPWRAAEAGLLVLDDDHALASDVNRDGVLSADDGLVLYYALALPQLLGRGDGFAAGGLEHFRATFLGGRQAFAQRPADVELRALLATANQAVRRSDTSTVDMNRDGAVTVADGLIIYYVLSLPELLGTGHVGSLSGFVNYRRWFLGTLVGGGQGRNDAELIQVLQRVHALR